MFFLEIFKTKNLTNPETDQLKKPWQYSNKLLKNSTMIIFKNRALQKKLKKNILKNSFYIKKKLKKTM